MQRVALKEKRVQLTLPLDNERVLPESGDLLARRLLIHAFLYYVMDAPIISDDEYDALSRKVAKRWDDLTLDRQWACGSAEEIRSSGAHCRFSSHCVGAALNYIKYKTGQMFYSYDDGLWRLRKSDGCRYVKCDAPKPRERM